jgi:hypothetical protein
MLVGRDVLDQDQPQLQLGRIRMDDPQALRDPRPDRGLEESRRLFSWNPVGLVGLDMYGQVGRVTVEIS